MLAPQVLFELGFQKNGSRPYSTSNEHALLRVKDSKLIPESDREPLKIELQKLGVIARVAEASVAEILELNILHASQLAMTRAVEALEASLGRKATHVLVDGNRVPEALRDRGRAIVKGDLKCLTIACASIFAKVYRDDLMDQADSLYPDYGFKKHKGYPTAHHQAAIIKQGSTPLHRQGFKGVAPI